MIEDAERQLVARGSGKWSQTGVPHKGWVCNGIDDLGAPDATCEMCEVQPIRYVHYMAHLDYPDELAVGCVCAGHMEQDYAAARDRERVLRNAARRRLNWLSRKRKVSRNGNPYLDTDGFNIVVFPKGQSWSARIVEKATDETHFARRQYETEDKAKLGAFDAMNFLKQCAAQNDSAPGHGE